MSATKFTPHSGMHFSHDFRVSIQGVDVTDHVVSGPSVQKSPDGSYSVMTLTLDNSNSRFVLTRDNLAGEWLSKHESEKRQIYGFKTGRMGDVELEIESIIGRDESALENATTIDDTARNPQDLWGGRVYPLDPNRAIFHRNDPITFWRKNPLTEEDRSNPQAQVWFAEFTGYIESYPFSEDMTGASPQVMSLTCYDVRALMQKMRVQSNFIVQDTENGHLRPTDILVKEGLFADVIKPSNLTSPLADQQFEDAVSLLITGKSTAIDSSQEEIEARWRAVGRMTLGGVGVWPSTPAQAEALEEGDSAANIDLEITSPDGLKRTTNLEGWNDIIQFGPKGRMYSYAEMLEVLEGTYTNGPHDPTNRNLWILRSSYGTIVSEYLTEWTYQNDHAWNYQWTNRLDLLDEICQNTMCTWYVTGFGDIAVEFRMWDFLPEDFGVYSGHHTADDHALSADYSDENGDYPTAILVQGSPGRGLTDIEFDGVAKEILLQSICFSRTLTARVGLVTETIQFPFTDDINRLTTLARVHMMLRLSNSRTAGVAVDDRPWVGLNRPFVLRERERAGMVSSVSVTLEAREVPQIGISLTNIRMGDPEEEGAFRTILGTTSMPLSWRYPASESNKQALSVYPDDNPDSLSATASISESPVSSAADNSVNSETGCCTPERRELEPAPNKTQSGLTSSLGKKWLYLQKLCAERLGYNLVLTTGYTGHCTSPALHDEGLTTATPVLGTALESVEAHLTTVLAGIADTEFGTNPKYSRDTALANALYLMQNWSTDIVSCMASVAVAWSISSLDASLAGDVSAWTRPMPTVTSGGIGIFQLENTTSSLGRGMTYTERLTLSRCVSQYREFSGGSPTSIGNVSDTAASIANNLGVDATAARNATLILWNTDEWSWERTAEPGESLITSAGITKLVDPEYLHPFFLDEVTYITSGGESITGPRYKVHLDSVNWELENVFPGQFSSVSLSETHRSVERQTHLYNTDASEVDGVTKKSRHNYWPSLAYDIDVGDPDLRGYDTPYQLAGTIGQELGMVWGGTWPNRVDPTHFEHPEPPGSTVSYVTDATQDGRILYTSVILADDHIANEASGWHRFNPSMALDFEIVVAGKQLDPLSDTNLAYYQQVASIAHEIGFTEIGAFFANPLPGHLAFSEYPTVRAAVEAGLEWWGCDEDVTPIQRPTNAIFERVVIDYGHGGFISGVYQTPGSKQYEHTDAVPPFTIFEGEINRLCAEKLMKLFLTAGIPVYDCVAQAQYTSSSSIEQSDVSLRTRTNYVNTFDSETTLFLSLHSNAVGNSISGPSLNAKGAGVFTFPGTDVADSVATKIHESFQVYLDGLIRVRGGETDDGDVDYERDFHVLRESNCPAVLGEVGFFTNLEEALVLLEDSTQDAIARGYFEGVKGYFG